MSRPPRPPVGDDLAWLLLRGTDDEVRAALTDPTRPKISVDEAVERIVRFTQAYGLTADEFERSFAVFAVPHDELKRAGADAFARRHLAEVDAALRHMPWWLRALLRARTWLRRR